MTDKTFHVTSEDLRNEEAKQSKFHGGEIPKDSDVSAMKVCFVQVLARARTDSPSNCYPSKSPKKTRSTE